MDAYTSFAEVYDTFMDDIPYGKWSAYIIGLLKEYGISEGIVADLGCGTGTVTRLLAAAGYDMIGIDSSTDMLDVAREAACPDTGQHDILYLLQDMREFELYGTVAAVVSVCDCINYITEPEELLQVFRLVNNYLDPQGLFIFDFHPEGYYREVLGDNVFAEDREDMSLIWENEYDAESRIHFYDLSFFVRGQDGRYDKYRETHQQRGYALDEIQALIAASGLHLIAMYDAFTREPAGQDCERVYVVAQEQGKAVNGNKKEYLNE